MTNLRYPAHALSAAVASLLLSVLVRAVPVPPHVNVVQWGYSVLPEDWSEYRAIGGTAGWGAGVRSDGTVKVFGLQPEDNSFVGGLTNVVDVTVGFDGGVALHADGRISPWGPFATTIEDRNHMPFDPATNIVAVTRGEYHAAALRADGRVMCAGDNTDGQCWPPLSATNLVQVAAGSLFTVGLRDNGRLVGWGSTFNGVLDFPSDLSHVVEIAASQFRVFARVADGRVRVFGDGVPGGRWEEGLTNAVAMASGWGQAVALRSDGRLWGLAGATPPPWIRGAVSVFNEESVWAAFIPGPLLVDNLGMPWSDQHLLPVGTNVVLHASFPAHPAASFHWKRNGLELPGVTGPTLAFEATPETAGRYEVGTFSGQEELVSQSVEFIVGVPLLRREPNDFRGESGGDLELSGEASAAEPLTYEWWTDGEPLAVWNARVHAFPTLPDTSQPVLRLTGTTPVMSAGYQLVARTAYGSVTSRVATVTITPAPLLDVQQNDYGGRISLQNGYEHREVGQTFVAGVSGLLDRVFLPGAFEATNVPVHITLADTVDGRPGTNILGRTTTWKGMGADFASFSAARIYLTAGNSYALILSAEILSSAAQPLLSMSMSDAYGSGQLWQRDSSTAPWSPAISLIESPVDLVFSTAVFPGLPDLRIAGPTEKRTYAVNEPIPLEVIPGPGFPAGTPVEIRTQDSLLARIEAPPFRFVWTPEDAGDFEIRALAGAILAETLPVRIVAVRPSNDDIASALPLTGENPTTSFSLEGASLEPDEVPMSADVQGHSIWWSWTAPRTGRLTLGVNTPDSKARVGVFLGSVAGAMVLQDSGQGGVELSVTAGYTYLLGVDTEGAAAQGTLRLALNDAEITTPQAGAVFTLPVTLSVNAVRQVAARALTRVEVLLDGNRVSDAAELPANLPLAITASGAHELQLRLTDAEDLVTHSAVVPFTVRPVNDRFANAILLEGLHAEVATSNAGATTETGRLNQGRGEPLYGDNQGGHSLWYRWVAPADGFCRLRGEGLSSGVLLGGYLGTAAGNLTEVGANAFNRIGDPAYFQAVAGRTYYLMVDGLLGEQGPIQLSLDLLPANDLFVTRRAIVTPQHSEFVDLVGASLEDTEPDLMPQNATASWWWTWKAEQSARMTIRATSDGSPVALGVYSGNKLRLLVPIAGPTDWGKDISVSFAASVGDTYEFALFTTGDPSGRAHWEMELASVILESPLQGATLPLSLPVPLSARFELPGEELDSVTFFANGAPIGSRTQPPLSLSWVAPQPGNYELKSVARTRSGAEYTSPLVHILVYEGESIPMPRLISSPDSYFTLVFDAIGSLRTLGVPAGYFGVTEEPAFGIPALAAWPAGVTRWESVGNSSTDFGPATGWMGALAPDGRIYLNGTTPLPLPEGVQRFVRLCPGWFQVIAIGDDGRAYQYGTNLLHLPDRGPWQDVSAGSGFLGALNTRGQFLFLLPQGEGFQVTGPIPHPESSGRWVRMSASSQQVILQDEQGQLYRINYGGGLGVDLQPKRLDRLDGGSTWREFSMGMLHVLGLTEDGRLFAWGRNWEGQLGTGVGAGDYAAPREVVKPPGVTAWIAFTAGRVHSMAIGNDGALYAWGWNAGGLGLPPSGALYEPTRVTSLENLTGSPVLFSRTPAEELPDGRFRLAFPTLLNRRYLVQYTDDLKIWKNADGQILGTGGTVEWIDAGPPHTDEPPNTGSSRLYRIVFAP